MDHVEYLNQIIEAERKAREIARNAQQKREGLQADLKTEESKMRENYLARAERRIGRVREDELSFADEAVRQLDEDIKNALRMIDSQALSLSDKWTEEIFAAIVGLRET